jgi:hypothetical protein
MPSSSEEKNILIFVILYTEKENKRTIFTGKKTGLVRFVFVSIKIG